MSSSAWQTAVRRASCREDRPVEVGGQEPAQTTPSGCHEEWCVVSVGDTCMTRQVWERRTQVNHR